MRERGARWRVLKVRSEYSLPLTVTQPENIVDPRGEPAVLCSGTGWVLGCPRGAHPRIRPRRAQRWMDRAALGGGLRQSPIGQATTAIGQATAAGLWTTELSSKIRGAMSTRNAAQLYASHFWHCGVMASSALSCRAATAAAIIALHPACLSTEDRARLQRLASQPPKATRSRGRFAVPGAP